MSESVSECCLTSEQFSAISWREISPSWLKQHSTGRYVTLFGHISLIPCQSLYLFLDEICFAYRIRKPRHTSRFEQSNNYMYTTNIASALRFDFYQRGCVLNVTRFVFKFGGSLYFSGLFPGIARKMQCRTCDLVLMLTPYLYGFTARINQDQLGSRILPN